MPFPASITEHKKKPPEREIENKFKAAYSLNR